MTETAVNTLTSSAPDPGLVSRVAGVFFSPRQTFAAVAARPRVLGVLLLTIAINAGAQGWFLSTEVGKEAYLDQATKTLESFGVNISDEAYDRMERQAAYQGYIQGGSILVITPILLAIIAGILMMVFNAFLGGEGTFKQVYAVLAHGSLIGALQQLFNVPLMYARGEMTSATRLSVFFPMIEERGFADYFLSSIDLFIVWTVVVTSIGLAVLYKRRTGPIATVQLALYVVIAGIIAAVRAS